MATEKAQRQPAAGFSVFKKAPDESAAYLVDPSGITWNTFFEYVIEWKPKLEKIYKEQQDNKARPDSYKSKDLM